jgi:cobalt-zinc-cadmium efflux system membrane fusion protein
MNTKQSFPFLVAMFAFASGCSNDTPTPASEAAGEAQAADSARGPNNGRLLRDGDFQVELAIFETGVPPEFRAWMTSSGAPVAPDAVDLRVTLTRLGSEDAIEFHPQGNFLRSNSGVREPHSFSVAIEASYQGRPHRWTYDSFEGRTRIDGEVAEAFGIATEIAGPARIEETVTLYGQIVPDTDRVRQISARFDGAIQSVGVSLGQSIERGQLLAVVESNESLQTIRITAPIAGVVTERAANAGEQTAGRRLFTIVDTSSVWADLSVFPADRARIRPGARVTIRGNAGGDAVQTTIAQINVISGANQAVTARAVVDNTAGALLPGTFVTADVAVAEHDVPLAVKRVGLQSFRDFTVVYAQYGDEYEVRMLELGRQFGDWAEVLGGLVPGTRYVTENSYVLKADVEKSGASHDH